MKIIRLQAENVKRLRAVEIKPDGNVVVISGRNGQGKSSILDSIWLALGGARATKDTMKPIRDGEEEASVTLDLGDFTVTRKWKSDKTTLAVMSKDGMKPSSPQKFLDEKLGALSFDPLAFAQSDPKSQLATLLGLVELPFNPDELAQRRRDAYDMRTEVGRSIKTAEGALASLPSVPAGTPNEEVSLTKVLDLKQEQDSLLQLRERAEAAVTLAVSRVRNAEDAIATAQKELAQAEFELEDAKMNLESCREPEIVDFTEMLTTLEATNENVRLRLERERIGTQLGELKLEQHNLSAKIENIDRDKADALAAAKMPIEGLGFDEDGVTYNGVPFSQSSSAEQLRVSVAMAMALNPDIRVIRISDGSLLDSENMALIAEMAQEHDYQCWIERVDETGVVGFVIEDGSVVGTAE